MDTNTLQAFLAVADRGSFSLAAEQLFLTQPAVSKRIATLEEELAVKLFERLGRRVLLTEAGRTLLPKAKHIMREMEESRRLIANLSEDVRGTLQLATSHHIGLHRLPDILRDYSRQFPQVEFDLHFLDSEAGCAAVAAGELEMAVVTLPQVAPEKLEIHHVWDDPLMLMVSREHRLADKGSAAELLALYPGILPEKGTVTRRLIENGLAAFGVTPRVGVETNYLETIRMLVSAGLGWSVLPLSMKGEDLACIILEDVSFHRQLGIVIHRSRTLSRAARMFYDILLAP
ncbi:LysR family transcriptional regulator [Desulfopila aestuarii]|uniref:Transcriptional regulator, LysR family n=1 Tax=Desulfopila aestuarii DSM 18488 TaxID=1121416 RepID=A0A1M7YBC3_9BACT|nr:LysR family transcriptional regulator [Desulfopila aestuarii]SHO49889.1 transcriptional regulator, LysR family [Desulfopila aestuarii DSM 18488]